MLIVTGDKIGRNPKYKYRQVFCANPDCRAERWYQLGVKLPELCKKCNIQQARTNFVINPEKK